MYDWDNTHLDDLPEVAPNLKWIQATSAGIGQFVKEKRYPERTKWIFTTASGVHIRPLGEFVIMSMLLFVKDYFLIQRQRETKIWKKFSANELRYYTLGIVGLGKSAEKLHGSQRRLTCELWGIPENLQRKSLLSWMKSMATDELDKLLKQANFLAICIPHTPETEGMIGAKELEMLPKGAVIINVSRGQVVDEMAMIDALKSGHLGGASLDVFAKEPLPADSPLWSMPNVVISPHSASNARDENKRLAQLFSENLKKYVNGEQLLNVLDTKTLY